MAKRVEVDIKTRGADKASRDLGKVDKGLGRLAKSAVATAGAFFGARMLLDGFKSLVDVTKQQALAEAQLNAVLKSTKNIAGLTSKELKNMASALQSQTRFGDEAIMNAQALLLTFTKVGKEVFPDAIETIMNMSEAMGVDMKQSVIQVGKALNDPILGVTALRRVGVQLSKQQEDSVKHFVEVGDIASAQKVILGELETQFGGVAKAAGETMPGALDQMRNAQGDAAQALGELLSPAIIEVANFFETAAKRSRDFYLSLRETELETTIRELSELGQEVKELELLRLQLRGSQLEIELQGKKDVNKIEEENKDLNKEIKDLTADITAQAKLLANTKKFESEDMNKISYYAGTQAKQYTQAYVTNKDLLDNLKEQQLQKLQEIENNLILKGQYQEALLIQKQITSLKAEEGENSGTGEDAEKEKVSASETFKKNSKDASTSLLSSAIQGRDMANAGKDFTKSVGLALIQLAAQLIIEKRITNEKRQQAALATAGKIFGFGFATGGSFINKFPTGGSFNVNKRTTLPTNPPAIVGDNASGMERIDITPLPAPPRASDRNITINISAPLVDETVVDHIIPAIRRAEKLNL